MAIRVWARVALDCIAAGSNSQAQRSRASQPPTRTNKQTPTILHVASILKRERVSAVAAYSKASPTFISPLQGLTWYVLAGTS